MAFIIFAISIMTQIGNEPLNLSLTFVIGLLCLIATPYCLRFAVSLRFLDFFYSDTGNVKVIIHGPAFFNEVQNLDEIDLNQIISTTRNKIFSNLVVFTIEEDGELKTLTSFIRKENLDFINNLSEHQSA